MNVEPADYRQQEECEEEQYADALKDSARLDWLEKEACHPRLVAHWLLFSKKTVRQIIDDEIKKNKELK